MSNMIVRWTLALCALVLSGATSFASTITYCNVDCGVYNGVWTPTPASGFTPYISLTQTALANLNADYLTPQTFNLPVGTTLVSFTLTPLNESIGTQFSIWANEQNPNNRLWGTNLNEGNFFGIVSDIPLQSIIVTTPNNGYPFRLENFMVGPTQANVAETPEPGTLAMLGSGLIAMGATARRRFNFFQLKRKWNAFRGPKREHTEAMRRVLDAMDGRERLVLLRYYADNKTVEEIAAEFGCSAEWIRAVKAEARSRFGAAIKTPCQGSLGDLIVSA